MKDNRDIAILDKEQISTNEIIHYLESVNEANAQIIQVLKKKPSLPGVEKLPWFITCQTELVITHKLKKQQKLNNEEILHLKSILGNVVKSIKKSLRPRKNDLRKGLEKYLLNIESCLG